MTEETAQKETPAFTREWMPRWLEAFRRERAVTFACDAVGLSRTHVYRSREADEAFREEWASIENEIVDQLEKSSIARAIDGWDETTFRRDRKTGKMEESKRVHKFDSTLAIFFLKSRRPDIYNRVQVGLAEAIVEAERAQKLRDAIAATATTVDAPPTA